MTQMRGDDETWILGIFLNWIVEHWMDKNKFKNWSDISFIDQLFLFDYVWMTRIIEKEYVNLITINLKSMS